MASSLLSGIEEGAFSGTLARLQAQKQFLEQIGSHNCMPKISERLPKFTFAC